VLEREIPPLFPEQKKRNENADHNREEHEEALPIVSNIIAWDALTIAHAKALTTLAANDARVADVALRSLFQTPRSTTR